jgi:hypothetical protein
VALALVHLEPAPGALVAVVGAVAVVTASWLTLVVVVSRLEPDLRNAAMQRIRRRSRR